jgi:hypothetical protein
MNAGHQTINNLFSQLGLPDGTRDVDAFIVRHQPLPQDMQLAEAPFWNEAQRRFLEEAFLEDADWAEAVDELDARLRH